MENKKNLKFKKQLRHTQDSEKVQWTRVLGEKMREKKGVLVISDNVTIDKDFPKMKKASSHILKKYHKQEGLFLNHI